MKIKVLDSEKADRKLRPEKLNQAVWSLREAGFVTLENVVSLKIINEISKIYFNTIHELGKPLKYPPVGSLFFHHEIVANSFALQVMEAVMGKKINFSLYFIKTVAAGEERVGAVHRDGNHLFPELDCVLPVSGIYIDIPLVDFVEENGATRLWPGSHMIMDKPMSDVRFLKDRSKHLPAVQMTMPLGSLTIRDMRLWHSAMPNNTDKIRPMLDLGYTRVFPHAFERYPVPQEIKNQWPKSARKILRTA